MTEGWGLVGICVTPLFVWPRTPGFRITSGTTSYWRVAGDSSLSHTSPMRADIPCPRFVARRRRYTALNHISGGERK